MLGPLPVAPSLVQEDNADNVVVAAVVVEHGPGAMAPSWALDLEAIACRNDTLGLLQMAWDRPDNLLQAWEEVVHGLLEEAL